MQKVDSLKDNVNEERKQIDQRQVNYNFSGRYHNILLHVSLFWLR